jgi:hypothetical protein
MRSPITMPVGRSSGEMKKNGLEVQDQVWLYDLEPLELVCHLGLHQKILCTI